jgi:spore coat protein SA
MSDLFILPSKKGEGFPLVVLEAFASGTPVIATKSGGHEEIIKNGNNGYLVDVDSAKQISNKILHLKSNKILLKKMAVNSRKLAEDYFSWNTNINNLNRMYKEEVN